MKSVVLGSGELGTACAMALLAADSTASVSLRSRDPSLLFTTTTTTAASQNDKSDTLRTFSVFEPQHHIEIPPRLSINSYSEFSGNSGLTKAVHVCAPVLPDNASAEKKGDSSAAAASTTNDLMAYLSRCASSGEEQASFVCLFSREWSPDGTSPQDAVRAHVGDAVPVLVACGSFLPREWARVSTADAAAKRRYSGTSITFAPVAPMDWDWLNTIEQQLRQSFARESVEVLRDSEMASLLSVVNSCLPLCAFGAGLVSNAYTGASSSALASYTQHAISATSALANQLAGRDVDASVPAVVPASIAFACTNFASQEFNVGRKLDFHFRRQDIAASLFGAGKYKRFAGNIEGLYTRMQAMEVESPFFGVLMDTFSTMLRASVSGEGLVRLDHYNYREPQSSPILEHVRKVDEAMLSGDAEEFERAKRNITKAFESFH